MRKIHWLALGAAAALLVNAGSAAAAPPDFKQAERLCVRQGGIDFNQFGNLYTCRIGRELTDRDLHVARRLCESAYKGSFVDPSPAVYGCTSIPSR
jgi:hypothetical protein